MRQKIIQSLVEEQIKHFTNPCLVEFSDIFGHSYINGFIVIGFSSVSLDRKGSYNIQLGKINPKVHEILDSLAKNDSITNSQVLQEFEKELSRISNKKVFIKENYCYVSLNGKPSEEKIKKAVQNIKLFLPHFKLTVSKKVDVSY